MRQWEIHHVYVEQMIPDPKFKFVVVAHAAEGYCLGFVINSELKDYARNRPHLLPCYADIARAEHPFLHHNSVVDCTRAFSIAQASFEPGSFRQSLSPAGIATVKAAILACPLMKAKHHALFL